MTTTLRRETHQPTPTRTRFRINWTEVILTLTVGALLTALIITMLCIASGPDDAPDAPPVIASQPSQVGAADGTPA